LAHRKPLVSVITPVYNGAEYLLDCIQSVRAQSFENFEYFIVDNCSTDESFHIAEKVAASDSRIKAIRSEKHVGPIQNWNRSLQSVSPNSSYIKFVHADDWIFPECLTRMVEVAESDENVGLVSAYRLEEDRVSLDQLPADAPLVPGAGSFTMNGQHVARAILRDKVSVLGSPTSVMFRSKMLPSDGQFFSEEFLHADKDACLRILLEHDFGFIRQVLTFTRRHNESVTSLTNSLDTRRQDNFLLLKKYGPTLQSEADYQSTVSIELRAYYDFLARRFGTGCDSAFWKSHREILHNAGHPLSRMRLIVAVLRRWMNPAAALRDYIRDTSHRDKKIDVKAMQFLAASRKPPGKDDT